MMAFIPVIRIASRPTQPASVEHNRLVNVWCLQIPIYLQTLVLGSMSELFLTVHIGRTYVRSMK